MHARADWQAHDLSPVGAAGHQLSAAAVPDLCKVCGPLAQGGKEGSFASIQPREHQV